jgi:hypothetical protein
MRMMEEAFLEVAELAQEKIYEREFNAWFSTEAQREFLTEM